MKNIGLCLSLMFVGCSSVSNDTGANDTGTNTSTNDTGSTDSCVQDYAGHAQCQESNGSMFFCGNEGKCIEASGCEAEDCCVPGESGDSWCQSTFGSCNECLVTENDGMCSTNECTE